MQIRAGYQISYDCPQPTPMILTLSVHPSRIDDLITLDRMRLEPPIIPNTYHDSFGNFCHVIRAPAGRLTMSADFLIRDSGEPDAATPQAEQRALEDLPVNVLIYLLGSRYCETDRLSNDAWSLFGQVPKGWPLVKRSVITSTIASNSATSTRARPKPPGEPTTSGRASAATSPIWRSRCADA